MTTGHHLLRDGLLDLERLAALATRPPRFEPHDAPFWDDPYIAAQMLAAHLDPTTDAASRQPETIARTVDWLADTAGWGPDTHLVDLGCGPGLYAQRFARRGLRVTGIDLSEGSLAYARAAAAQDGLSVEYLRADYTRLAPGAQYDAAVLIFWDFCMLPDDRRDALLRWLHAALPSGGRFAFDVTTPARTRPEDGSSRWEARAGGFWRPGPYLELTRTYQYPDTATDVRQTIIVEPDGRATAYRIWNQAYTPASISALLMAHGFRVRGVWEDLHGTPLTADAPTLGVLAERA